MNNFYFLIIIAILADKCNRFRIYKCEFFFGNSKIGTKRGTSYRKNGGDERHK